MQTETAPRQTIEGLTPEQEQAEAQNQETLRRGRQRERDHGVNKLELPCANGQIIVGHLREFLRLWHCPMTIAARHLLNGNEHAMRTVLKKDFFEWVFFDPHSWRRLLRAITHEDRWNEAGTIYDLKSGEVLFRTSGA